MGYTREELQVLPRAKLQAICKGIGFKANESTSKIIENILTYEADNAAHRLRSARPVTTSPLADPITRRVTRGSESSKQNQTQESKSMRRTSSRLSSNTLKGRDAPNHGRKSKATQISLGVGRPKAAGGLGARAVTRSSTSSTKSRDLKKGKERIVKDIIEEEEESNPSEQAGTVNEEPGSSGVVVMTGLPPTPAATPKLAGTSQSEESQDTSTSDFTPVARLQNEMLELSAQHQTMKEQFKQFNSLQQEVRGLRTAIDRQAGEFDQFRKETRGNDSLKNEVLELKQEIKVLREALVWANSNQIAIPTHGSTGQSLLNQNVDTQAPGSTIQVLGKRGRDSPTILASPFTANVVSGRKLPVNDAQGLDAASLTAMQSPKKKQRVEDDESTVDETDDIQSPFRLGSRDEHDLVNRLPSSGMDFSSLFNFNNAQNLSTSDVASQDHNTDTMLGVPPPGFTANFLTHPTTPLPFALTPSSATDSKVSESITNTGLRRDGHHISPRKVTGSRLNPYRRTTNNMPPSRLRTPSHGSDPFNFLGSDLLSSNMHSANHPEPSVGVNPAQLLAQNIFDPEKTPAATRTLYGTELEGDTRFGEFGIDGLTKNFWKAPGFPC